MDYPSQKGSYSMGILFGMYVKTKLVETQQAMYGQWYTNK